MAYRVSLIVGDGYAPGSAGIPDGRGGQVAGQGRVDRADRAELPRPVGETQQGNERNRQVGLARETGRDHSGQWPAKWRIGRLIRSGRTPAVRT